LSRLPENICDELSEKATAVTAYLFMYSCTKCFERTSQSCSVVWTGREGGREREEWSISKLTKEKRMRTIPVATNTRFLPV